MKENVKEEKVMKILIFTCLCQRATHIRDVALDLLQMLLVLFAAHNEGKDVFLQLKTRHVIRIPLRNRENGPEEWGTFCRYMLTNRQRANLLALAWDN